MEKLKSCPFCGSEPIFKTGNDHHGDYYTLGCSNKECICWLMIMDCADSKVYGKPMKEAIKQWNQRVNNV